MRRVWLVVLGVILVAGAAVAVFLAVNKSRDSRSGTTAITTAPAAAPQQACSIFTLADAKQILGADVRGAADNGGSSSEDLAVSSCNYTQSSGAGAPVTAVKTAGLLVRKPKTDAGAQSNLSQFDQFRPAGVQDVSGYGDSAYWDPQYGQLDILKNNTWYILSYGPTAPAARSLDQAKQLADLLIDKM